MLPLDGQDKTRKAIYYLDDIPPFLSKVIWRQCPVICGFLPGIHVYLRVLERDARKDISEKYIHIVCELRHRLVTYMQNPNSMHLVQQFSK